MKILAVSDIEVSFIYSSMVRERFQDIDLVISCGDLPYFYLEYIQTMLNVPLYYVLGNHSNQIEYGTASPRIAPWGARDLHLNCVEDETGLLLAGIEGSARYNNGPHQYTQSEYWGMALRLVPRLFFNRLSLGRYLDILVTHAPPWNLHDAEDPPHRGIKAFSWLIKVFQPQFLLHGHVHVYRKDTVIKTVVDQTIVQNVCGFSEINIPIPKVRSWLRSN